MQIVEVHSIFYCMYTIFFSFLVNCDLIFLSYLVSNLQKLILKKKSLKYVVILDESLLILI